MRTDDLDKDTRITRDNSPGGRTVVSFNGRTERVRPESFEKQEKDWDDDKWSKVKKKTKERVNDTL